MYSKKYAIKFAALLIWLCNLSAVCFAQANPQTLLNKLPESYAGFSAKATVYYGEPGLGYSRSYNGPGPTLITLYLYDLNKKQFTSGISDPTVVSAYRSAQGEIKEMGARGNYTNVRQQDQRTLSINPASQPFLYSRYSFVLPKNNQQLDSRLYVTGLHNLIFKVRVTQAAGRGASDAELQQFISMALKQFR